MLSHALFAYGTLMRGEVRHPLLVSGGIASIEQATVGGTLFDLGAYPGLQMPGAAPGTVHGEYVLLRDLDESLLKILDTEEGDEYRRELVTVRLQSGCEATAWTYLYLPATDGKPVIGSGDWRSRRSP